MTAVRSALFLVLAVLLTIPFGIAVPLAGLFGYRPACATAKLYAAIILNLARLCCGIRWSVAGTENFPDRPVVLMAKHQSAWETVYMNGTFPPQCWIVKKELLWLPFLGWGLMGIRCIAIDRGSGKSARDQIVEKGALRIAQGMCVSIFPEGTRIPVGKRGRYGMGGALLATTTGTPIVPIAHNAGEFWGRNAFRKHAGTVRVVIGKPIETAGREAAVVNEEVEEWIEARMRELNPERYADA
jgi:1-acyl-sn-glycerol-3-phosphate acyltransferase